MQNQQAGEAILLYDEINRKGFEGDEVLNGFSEFLRNTLVSKDSKVAILLEVSEGFKARYLETASKINDSWLLSALNIVNESEINYRLAKNKRLHVELAFIKLCYLGQALELDNDKGQLSKKKQVDGVKSVSFRSLSPVANKLPSENISKVVLPKKNVASLDDSSTSKNDKAKLVIESEKLVNPKIPKSPTDNTYVSQTLPKSKFTRLGSLEKIREKVARDNKNNYVKELNEEELYIAWGSYIEKLMNSINKPIVSNFKTARLSIFDQNCIEITCNNNLQQKFIDAERGELITHLQSHFNNRSLTYKLKLEIDESENEPKEEHLNTKQQYLRIIEEYPLVKLLKDSLGMQLDY